MQPDLGPGIDSSVRRASLFEITGVAAAFACGVGLYLGPSLGPIASSLGPDLGDPRLNLYFATWVAESIRRGFSGLWSPPFFYPTPGALAFSDHLIGPGTLVWLAGKIGVGPVATFNALFLLSFLLTGLFTHLLLRRLGLPPWPSLLASWGVAFSHQRWAEISHYQVLRTQWIPAVLWSFDRFLQNPKPRSATIFLAFYLLHVSGGTYLAFMVHVPMLVILIYRSRELARLRRSNPRELVTVGVVGAAAVVILTAFVWGYVAEWGERTVPRSLDEIRDQGAVLGSLWAPSHGSLLRRLGTFVPDSTRGALFPGFATLLGCAALAVKGAKRRLPAFLSPQGLRTALLFLVGAWLVLRGAVLADAYTLEGVEASWLAEIGLRRYNGPRTIILLGLVLCWLGVRLFPGRARGGGMRPRRFSGVLLGSGAICLWLSFPVGFTMLNHHVPGMSGMRVSHRFFVFVALALAYPAARGIEHAMSALESRATVALLVAGLACVAILEAAPRGWDWAPVPGNEAAFPAYSRFIAGNADVRAYVEYPAYLDYRASEWMLNQTIHWKPLVNGYSARIASSYRRVAAMFDPFPSVDDFLRLHSLGVTHVVVHWPSDREARRPLWRRFGRELSDAERSGWLAQVFESEGVSVYAIKAPQSGTTGGATP